MSQKVLITGSNGQLGKALRREIANDPAIDAIFTDVEDLDITNREAVERFISDNHPDIIVNCAAYTAVDRAETDNIMAAAINTGAVGNLGVAAARHGVKIIHISTDYVFSGKGFRPYAENDEPYPQSIYGRTKLEGEGLLLSFCPKALIIRTAWLYSEFGNNFVSTMLRRSEDKKPLNVVCDQIGSPTYAGDLARAIHHIINYPEWKPGLYHFTNEGVASWYDFAKMIFELSGISIKVNAIPSSEYPTPAKRPLYSVLGKQKIKKTFGIDIPWWRDSLKLCLKRISDNQ